MDAADRGHASLFHSDDADIRVFFFTLAASILVHLSFVVALIFASEYSPAPPLAASVIDVTMVTLPESRPGPGPSGVAEPAAPADEPDPLTQAELETLLIDQQAAPPPEPKPETPPEPETPSPEPALPTPPAPAREQVVIDPKEPKEPPPETPKEEKTAPPPKPETPPEKPAPVPVKAPKFTKPSAPPEAMEAPAADQDSVKQAIAEIQKKIARRTEGRYRVAPEAPPEEPAPPRRTGSGGTGDGSAGGGTLGLQAKAAITSYAGSVLPDRINRNWAFSEHLASRRFNLEAVLVIRIRSDGEIVDIWFEKKSGDRYFDNSAYNAVVKSNPLPPLPQAYTAHADTYTIGLRFTPSGLN
jgi:outer membrane biosynthesis protein TonB